tara:strand:- start:670 stop:1716 length:1047 start_codon:yes stop_codon:yes gene_type:complete
MTAIATRLLNIRANAPVDRWEVIASNYGAYNCFRDQTNSPTGIISDDLRAKALAAYDTTLSIPVLEKEAFTITNVSQPVTIAGDPGTSALYNVTFIDYYFGFRSFPTTYHNNEITEDREFARKLKGFETALMKALEAAALTALETAKTQVLTDNLGGRYTLTGNIITAPLAEQEYVLGDSGVLFAGNDMFSELDIVGNNSFNSMVRTQLKENGAVQAVDKNYQWQDKTMYFSNSLTNPADVKATFFGIQKDCIGFLQQFAPDCVAGSTTRSGYEWDIETLPMSGLQIGVMTYDDAIDGSAVQGAATAGMTATKMIAQGFHFRGAFLTPYNSAVATIASPIAKFTVATT